MPRPDAPPFRPKKFRAWVSTRRTGGTKAYDARIEVDGREQSKRLRTSAACRVWVQRLHEGWAKGWLYDPVARQFVDPAHAVVATPSLWSLVTDHLEARAAGWQPRTLSNNASTLADLLICVGGAPAKRAALGRHLGRVVLHTTTDEDTVPRTIAAGEVTAEALQAWISAKVRDGNLAAADRALAVTKPVFTLAVQRLHLTRNPMDGVELPTGTTPADEGLDPDTVLDADEVLDLADAMAVDHPAWVPLVLLCGLAGLRPGEAVCVTRGDLTLPAKGTGWVTVTGSAMDEVGDHWRAGDTSRVGPMKARALGATRRAPIPAAGIAVLRPLLEELADDDLVITCPPGLSNFRRRVWAPLVTAHYDPSGFRGAERRRRAKLATMTPHALRHAAATMWLNAGVPPTTAQRWGGWRTLSVMLDVYAGVTRGDETVGLARLAGATDGLAR